MITRDRAEGFLVGALFTAAGIVSYRWWMRSSSLSSKSVPNPRKPEELIEPAAAIANEIVLYRQSLLDRKNERVCSNVKAGALAAALPQCCPEQPESWDNIISDVRKHIIPALTHWESPDFFAYFKPHASVPSVLGEFLCAGFNCMGFSWISSPAATELEAVVCDWVAGLLQLPAQFYMRNSTSPAIGGGGVIQGSAGEAVLVAMVAARENVLQALGVGSDDQKRASVVSRLTCYISDQTHSIVAKAWLILGLPKQNLRVLPTARSKGGDVNNYALAPADVEEAILRDVEAGLLPFFVVPTIGTTSTAAVDPVLAIARAAKRACAHVWVGTDRRGNSYIHPHTPSGARGCGLCR
jgi:aromatic-L-amino-acid decarboxylase